MDIKSDSRKIKKGDTFIALKYINDGHEYILDAIERGASKVIVEKGLYSVDTLVVKDTHEYLIKYLKDNYWDQIKDLKIIGATGTNGKTTTCFLLHKALNMLDEKCAYIGTLGFYIDNKIKDLNNTTPDILDIYELLLEAKSQNCKYVVMEVSSHALSLNRVEGIEFDMALFTNLTQDHLDYHHTIDNYLNAKKKLFNMLRNDRVAIINIDDKYYKDFIMEENNNKTYGFKDCNYQITKYTYNIKGGRFVINDCDIYETNLIGKYNVYNLTLVISTLNNLGFDYDKVYNVIKKIDSPSGRMDKIMVNSNAIIIDYAHTPDAVEKAIQAVKELNPNNIYTIVGCGGNRDKTKRPIMGKIAVDNSTLAIFTSDNPRCEEPHDIINDMIQNIDKNNYEIEVNREKAIIRGIQLLKENDILMILGKGHENYQIINNTKIFFDDKKVVLDNI